MAFLGSCIFCLISLSLLFGLCFSVSRVAEFELEFSYKYLSPSPLGVPDQQQVIAVNGWFPGPILNVTASSIVTVNVKNNLDENLLISWSGLRMRRELWQDGVLGTNCPIPPNQNWTYRFHVKDQIGSFFYFPSLNLQRSAGGFGSFIISNNLSIAPLPYKFPDEDIVVFIGDWYNQSHKALRKALDSGNDLGIPDGVLINGKGPYNKDSDIDYEIIDVFANQTYRIRVHNVGLSTCLNFAIQNHTLVLVEAEGHYTVQQNYTSFDIHVGQSYTFLVTMNQTAKKEYYILASPMFVNGDCQWQRLKGVAILHYVKSKGKTVGPIPPSPECPVPTNIPLAIKQALSVRQHANASGAGRSHQGSFNYSKLMNFDETFILRSTQPSPMNGTLRRAAFNGVSFKNPDYPIMLADIFNKSDVYDLNFPKAPIINTSLINTSLINGTYNHSVQIILQNDDTVVQSFHMDGYSFFVLGMGNGSWTEREEESYNRKDAAYRSTIQVFPGAWTAIMVHLDNVGVWNLRVENLDRWYLGQETYIRVVDPRGYNATVLFQSLPDNVLYCGAIEGFSKPNKPNPSASGVGRTKLYLSMLMVFSASIFSILC